MAGKVIPVKLCSKCRETLPVSEFPKSAKSKDGLGWYCRQCKRLARSRESRDRKPTERDLEKSRARSAAWRSDNAAAIKKYKDEYRSKNSEKISAYDRQYRDDNSERLLSQARGRSSKWRSENPDKARMKDGRRRALKKSSFVENVDVSRVYEISGGGCFVCGESIDKSLKFPNPMSLTLEHVIPLALGGEHSYANCSVSHYRCNASKGARI